MKKSKTSAWGLILLTVLSLLFLLILFTKARIFSFICLFSVLSWIWIALLVLLISIYLFRLSIGFVSEFMKSNLFVFLFIVLTLFLIMNTWWEFIVYDHPTDTTLPTQTTPSGAS